MGYHIPRQTNPYPQGNVQGGQPQDSSYNNQRSSRSHSHSHQPSVQTVDNPTLNRSLSTSRTPVVGQTPSFDGYGTGQNREAGLPYVPAANTPQYIGAQGQAGQVPSPSYQDPSQGYQSEYFPLEGPPPHLVSQQTRTHQPPPQQPSVPQNPSHSVQGQYSQYQRGDVEYPAGHVQQRRPSSSQYTQQQQQPSTQHYSQQPQSSQPQYQQQPSTQLYSQHEQPLSPQQRRQYQASSQQYPQQQQQPSSQQYTQQQQQPSSRQYTQQQQQPSSQQYTQQQQQLSSQQYTQQQQSLPLRQQGNFTTTPANAVSSFGTNAPGEIYEMPGEETRQSRSMRRGATHAGPLCRLTNCRNAAVREVATQELSEYCSLEHMQEDIRRGATLCPACNKCPRRINGRYCGSPCEKWDMDRLRQPQQQQQHYPKPPSGARPHLSTPSSSPANANWGTTGESSHVGNYASDNQFLSPVAGGLVHCPNCNTTYSARGTSRPRYGGQGIPVDVSLPPCPTCGFSRRT